MPRVAAVLPPESRRTKKQRHSNESRCAKADKLPFGQVERHFGFDLGQIAGHRDIRSQSNTSLMRSEDGFRHGAGLEQTETEQNGVAHNAPNGVDGIPRNRYRLYQHGVDRHADEDEKALKA